MSWEIARIACDPRTVMLSDEWRVRLPDLLASYRAENPSIALDDLASTMVIGCAYTVSSSYPLAEPIRNPAGVDLRSRPTPGHVTTPPCACSPNSTAPLNSAARSSRCEPLRRPSPSKQ